MTWEGVVTLLLAVYGAGLSTLLGVLKVKESRRDLKVSCRITSRPISATEAIKVIEVTCVNVGHRPIEVKEVSLETMTGQVIRGDGNVAKAGTRHKLPEVLNDGESLVAKFVFSDVITDLKGIETAAKSAVPVRMMGAVVTDAEGKKRRAKFHAAEYADLARLLGSSDAEIHFA